MLDRSADHRDDAAATPHSVAIPLNDVSAADLQREVERQHACKAVLIATEPVTETLAGDAVWQGDVHHFVLCGHPTADMAYAWSSSRDGGATRRVVGCEQNWPLFASDRNSKRLADDLSRSATNGFG